MARARAASKAKGASSSEPRSSSDTTSLPELPEEVLEEIRRAAEESSRRIMEKVGPEMRRALLEALKKGKASQP